MKISNYHTHTMLCHHAVGMPADYVAQAVKDGCSALGFSDHCPYPCEMSDYWPEIRMDITQVHQYTAAVKEAAATAPFPVYLGFECEWDAGYKNWYSDALLGTYGARYLVFGAHWYTEGKQHIYVQDISDTAALHVYTDQTIQGIRSGLFTFLAHPDLLMGGWKYWDREAESCLHAILQAAVDCNMPVEINGYGMVKEPVITEYGSRFQYPIEEFWKIAAESGAEVLCNSDAHDPADVIKNARLARTFAEKMGIKPVENLLL
jgi:histidinol-phosphatase (PHP family)